MLGYAPDDNDMRPIVLLLHGAGGYEKARGLYERHAALLVSHGYRVYALLYYDDQDQLAMAGKDRKAMRENRGRRFRAWMEVVTDAMDHISHLPGTDKDRIGILGFSLGAYIAVGVAGTDNRVAAVVEKYGGVPKAVRADIHQLPPILIVHGEADRNVPVAEAHALAAFMDELGSRYVLKTYVNAGHGFDAKRGSADAEDAIQETLRFLNEYLADRGPE